MVIRNSTLLSIAFVVGAFGCHDGRPQELRDGSVEFGVTPERSNARYQALRGDFTIRGLDNTLEQRVIFDEERSPTLRVPLPSGSYLLSWEPKLTFDGASIESPEPQTTPIATPPRVIVVAPARVTSVAVRVTPLEAQAATQVSSPHEGAALRVAIK